MRALLTLVCLAAAGCGSPRPIPFDLDDDLAGLPSVGPPALQLYGVLTTNPAAMQAPDDVKTLFKSARGETADFKGIRRQISWIPGDYALDITLDFADLPHPLFSPKRMAALHAQLPANVRAKAKSAQLIVLMRSTAPVLPNGGHIRLAGAAALYAAEKYDGIVFDLLSNRAYTACQWRRLLSAPTLVPQHRVVVSTRGDRSRLMTRGHARLGLPDLLMFTPTSTLGAARRRFDRVHKALLKMERAQAGQSLMIGAKKVLLTPCTPQRRRFDAGCIQVSP